MIKYILVGIGWLYSTYTMGIVFPYMTKVEITSCYKGTYECSREVDYSGERDLLTIEPIHKPRHPFGQTVYAAGVHCNIGDKKTGVPFRECKWDSSITHAPRVVSSCFLDKNSWEFYSENTGRCSTQRYWGGHSGAGPGGECVLFGYLLSNGNLATPMGEISATEAANSGNRFCIKPLPPQEKCDVTLPQEIDHGVVRPGSIDTKQVQGTIDCGNSPEVTVVGGDDVAMGTGVVANISFSIMDKTVLQVQSVMRTDASASPGDYSRAVVIAVSPY